MRGIRSSQSTGGAPVILRPMREDIAATGPTVTRLSINDIFPGPRWFEGLDEGRLVGAGETL